jgi:hypothetical protein
MAFKNKQDGVIYRNNYAKNNYDRINILAKKGVKAQVQAAASASGENISTYIIQAIRTRMASEGFNLDIADQTPDQSPDQTQK